MDLDKLIALQPTHERLSLRGSAHKRLALVALRARTPDRDAVTTHVAAMRDELEGQYDSLHLVGPDGIGRNGQRQRRVDAAG